MSFVGNVARGLSFKRDTTQTSDDLAWWGNLWSSPSATGIQINQQTALMVPTVMACVSIVSEDIAKLTPQVYRPKENGGKTIAKDHWLYKLLRRPTPWQTWAEWCMQMMAGLVLRGNAYAVIIRNGRGIPQMLVPVNPDRVALWEAPDGSLWWMVTRAGLHEMAVLRGYDLLIPFDDVMHWQGLSPRSSLPARQRPLR